jgi:hypothetical protein
LGLHRASAIIARLTAGLLFCCSATGAFAGACDAAGGTPAKPEINRAAPSPAAAGGPGSYGIARNSINAEATRALRTDSKGR